MSLQSFSIRQAGIATGQACKNVLSNTLLFCVSLLVTLLIAEIIFYFLNRYNPVTPPDIATFQGQPNQERLDFFQYHPVYGYAGIPNVSKTFLGKTITHNSRGLRGPELPFKKPDNVKRIAFIGDSQTWGWAVNDGETIPELTSRVLNKELRAGTVEVLNFGATGYGVDQSYLRLITEGLNYDPDVVVFTFFADNDVWESTEKEAWGVEKPYFYEKPNGKLCVSNIPPRRASGWPADNINHIIENKFNLSIKPIQISALTVDLGESNIARYFKHRSLNGALLNLFGNASGDPLAAIEKHVGCLEKEPGPLLSSRAAKVRHTLNLIALTRDTVEANGGEFYVITKPLEEDYRNTHLSLEYKTVLTYLRQHGIALIDLYSEAQMVQLNPNSMFIGYGHLSPQGNYLAARKLGERISGLNGEPTLAGE
ncbi:SGNH/GDSL hydrolase family protein [Teredinibacter purpureus]|uniref:SGNH/GDSL hydrolase family protein n=1 Tax=Teredinibacter purpureus TaxID=2731756 RepID=UPI0005F86C01|nr:SGNH/GDSL hydrolase family protein [Teredinibacter purpureus]